MIPDDPKNAQGAPEYANHLTGNASNPDPDDNNQPEANKQLLNKKAEKYLRESGNIEDLPDAEEQAEADEVIEKEKDK
jgi:hypothetical protein